jgi:hypothetical protein
MLTLYNTLCLHNLRTCSSIVKHLLSTDSTAHFPLEVPEYVYTAQNVCNIFFEAIVVVNMRVCNVSRTRACLVSHSQIYDVCRVSEVLPANMCIN